MSTVASIFMSLRLRCRRWLRFRLSSLTTNSPCWHMNQAKCAALLPGAAQRSSTRSPGWGARAGRPDASRCVHPGPSILKAGPSLCCFQLMGRYSANLSGIAFWEWGKWADFGLKVLDCTVRVGPDDPSWSIGQGGEPTVELISAQRSADTFNQFGWKLSGW